MADLDPLIRYRKHDVDERRRFLAKLYEEMEKLEQARKQADEDLKRETALAHEIGTAESLSDLGKYIEAMKQGMKFLDEAIKKMETRIAVAQEDMRTAFAEMKKVEITQRKREEREGAELKRKEDKELDEVAIENYRRRQEEE